MKNKSILRKSAVLLLALVMAFSFSLTSVFAKWVYEDNDFEEENPFAEGGKTVYHAIHVNSNAGDILYQGEKYYIDFDVTPIWSNALSIPQPMKFWIDEGNLWLEDLDKPDYFIINTNAELQEKGGCENWKMYLDIGSKSLPLGTYAIAIPIVPVDPETYEPMDYDVYNETPMAINEDVELRKLGTPQSLKLTSGKKKVTISYSKVTGASKYEIYRSTKSSSGFSKIATTTALKYVDKKAKKGKRYYYKVRAVRQIMTSGVDLGYAKNLKAKLSNGKTTITYSKVTNATKYEIYRSTKSTSGFKKIATVTGTKYVSKTSKKYYYLVKVTGKKNLRGTAYGSYTSAKRCSKVK